MNGRIRKYDAAVASGSIAKAKSPAPYPPPQAKAFPRVSTAPPKHSIIRTVISTKGRETVFPFRKTSNVPAPFSVPATGAISISAERIWLEELASATTSFAEIPRVRIVNGKQPRSP